MSIPTKIYIQDEEGLNTNKEAIHRNNMFNKFHWTLDARMEFLNKHMDDVERKLGGVELTLRGPQADAAHAALIKYMYDVMELYSFYAQLKADYPTTM